MTDIIIDTLIDAIKILPFLYCAFLIIELLEHRISNKSKKIIEKSDKLGPIVGSALGMVPQCGFSVLATNLYITRIISLGTLIAIYLSTSDEMLPILITEKVNILIILRLVFIKFIIGMFFGLIIDFILRRKNKNIKQKKEDYSICHDQNCHCDEEGIFLSSLKHTIKTIVFVIIITFILNIIMEYLGNDYISKIFLKNNFLAPFISSLIGLIPNCSASIILTELYVKGAITLSSTIAGLLTSSGVAMLILFRTNKNVKENLFILSLVYAIGVFCGVVAEFIEFVL